MRKLFNISLLLATMFFMASCSSSKNATDMKATTGNLSGKWTISDIVVNVPAGFKVTDVFDEAPYADFKGSTWDLVRNGKGSFTLMNGNKEDIYWSVKGKGADAQFQFKKLMGSKARNVLDGYHLNLMNISSNGFVARSPLDIGDGQTGYITYTFTK